jgi:putative heme degradation protein
MTLKENCDIKIGERSLKNFIDRVEEQLAILRPAPELEDRWEKLKDLRQQYEALKADIVEKEKIMKILKEK